MINAERERLARSYIADAKKRGYSESQIRQALVNAGFSKELIRKLYPRSNKVAKILLGSALLLLVLAGVLYALLYTTTGEDLQDAILEFTDSSRDREETEPTLADDTSQDDTDVVDDTGDDSSGGAEAQCGDGVCSIGEESCVEDCGCIDDSVCASDEECVSGVCVDSSSGSSGGGSSSSGGSGDSGGSSSSTPECTVDEECSDGYVCTDEVCVVSTCFDGIDNDEDGLYDYYGFCDFDNSGVLETDLGEYVCQDETCNSCTDEPAYQIVGADDGCFDLRDNDGELFACANYLDDDGDGTRDSFGGCDLDGDGETDHSCGCDINQNGELNNGEWIDYDSCAADYDPAFYGCDPIRGDGVNELDYTIQCTEEGNVYYLEDEECPHIRSNLELPEVECENDGQCDEGFVCDEDTYSCIEEVECEADVDCDTGYYCLIGETNSCEQTACFDGLDNDGDNSYDFYGACDADLNGVIEVDTSTDHICDDASCGGCEADGGEIWGSDSECISLDDNTEDSVCDVASCSEGYACDENLDECLTSCDGADGQCVEGYICDSGACVEDVSAGAVCESDDDCAAGSSCVYREEDPRYGECIACVGDWDGVSYDAPILLESGAQNGWDVSGDLSECITSQLDFYYCDESGDVVQAVYVCDDDCFDTGDGGFCGVYCENDVECGSGHICNTDFNVCEEGESGLSSSPPYESLTSCREDAGCESDEVCTSGFCYTVECSDGIDNDGDGFVDYADDSDCDDALDNSEGSEGSAAYAPSVEGDGIFAKMWNWVVGLFR